MPVSGCRRLEKLLGKSEMNLAARLVRLFFYLFLTDFRERDHRLPVFHFNRRVILLRSIVHG